VRTFPQREVRQVEAAFAMPWTLLLAWSAG